MFGFDYMVLTISMVAECKMKTATRRASQEAQLNAQIMNCSAHKDRLIIPIKQGNSYVAIYLSMDDILQFEQSGQGAFRSPEAAIADAKSRIDAELTLVELDIAES